MMVSRVMVSFRDSVATDLPGHRHAPTLESAWGFRRGSVDAGAARFVGIVCTVSLGWDE
jgi:hypothetical protein